jgi:hypothetical protein
MTYCERCCEEVETVELEDSNTGEKITVCNQCGAHIDDCSNEGYQ